MRSVASLVCGSMYPFDRSLFVLIHSLLLFVLLLQHIPMMLVAWHEPLNEMGSLLQGFGCLIDLIIHIY